MTAMLEHANLTVPNARETARWLCEVFGWRIRWQGPAIDDGHTVHVGDDRSYLAIYQPATAPRPWRESLDSAGGLNHVGIRVDDLDTTEARVKAAGFTPFNHADYDPGRRFYFRDGDHVEYEVVEYA